MEEETEYACKKSEEKQDTEGSIKGVPPEKD